MTLHRTARSLRPVYTGPRELYVRLGRAREARRLPGEPILICGCGRSGTTLLLAILDAHPHILGVDETDMFGAVVPRAGGAPAPSKLYRLYRHLLLRRIPEGTRRYAGKRPSSVRDVGALLAYFEERVRIVHLVRDARDVCTSRHPRRPDRYWVSIERWVQDVGAGLQHAAHPRVHTLRYEDLVGEPAATLRALFAFLQEPAEALPRDWHAHSSIRRAKAWFGDLQAMHRSSVGRWRAPEYAERVREILADERARGLLERLGYPTDGAAPEGAAGPAA